MTPVPAGGAVPGTSADLRRQIRDRREVLRRELELGEDRLRALQRETVAVQQTTLRISGAIQVLTELLGDDDADPVDPPPPGPAAT